MMVDAIQELRMKLHDNRTERSKIAIELNTSCPNIRNAPPSGYSFSSLSPLLQVLANSYAQDPTLTIGLKLPPYVYADQFKDVFTGLKTLATEGQKSPIAFLTCTNTLGNSLLFSSQTLNPGQTVDFAVPTGLGGLAGESLHPLALGNVYSFKQLILSPEAEESGLNGLKIIGVGGITSKKAADSMKRVGADVIACATLLGREGIRAFEILGKD